MEIKRNSRHKKVQAKNAKNKLKTKLKKTVLSYEGSSVCIHINSTSIGEPEVYLENEHRVDSQLEADQIEIYDIKKVTDDKDFLEIKKTAGQLLGGPAVSALSMLSGCNQKQDEENKLNVDFGVCQERD